MQRRINILANLDWLTVFIYMVLVAFGWMNIYAVSMSDNPSNILKSRWVLQLFWIACSLILIVVIFIIDTRFYSFFAYALYGITIFLLMLVFVVGVKVNDARSWISIGGFSLQPAEFAKLTTALALARYLSGFNVKINQTKTVLISLGIIALPALLIIIQPDWGSTMVFAVFLLVLFREGLPGYVLLLLLFLAVVFFASLLLDKIFLIIGLIALSFIVFYFLHRNFKIFIASLFIYLTFLSIFFILKYLELLRINLFLVFFFALVASSIVYIFLSVRHKISKVIVVLLFLYSFIAFTYSVDFVFSHVIKEHQQRRVNIILGLESDPQGYEYNVRQSKIAIGSGGFSGKGYLQGSQTKFKFVPEQSTDFIFCAVGEEWGFLGSVVLVGLFIGLLLRIVFIAERQRSKFSRIYGYGVLSLLFFHFAVNIGMTIELFPVIGIPLPFISYGGSSLMTFTALLFILLKLDVNRKAHLI
jgi:rod shape determining protein RodA